MIVSKVGRRGQISLPRQIRRLLKLKEGDRLAFLQKGGEVFVQPLRHTLLDMRGSIRVSSPQDFASIRREVIKSHAQKTAKE
jgi:antitoxin PrlF